MPRDSAHEVRAENARLRADAEQLRRRMEEAEQALEAIRTGMVDSLVVEGPNGPRMFSLEGAEQSYRVLVEAMNEGAATLGEDGTILYCNTRLAEMLDTPLERVMGGTFARFVVQAARAAFDRLLRTANTADSRGEIGLVSGSGQVVPSYVSVSAIVQDGTRHVCLVATDLRAQKRNEEIVAAERLALSVLEQAADAIVVCDEHGRIIRASRSAVDLRVGDVLLVAFDTAFPLELTDHTDQDPQASALARVMRGEVLRATPAALTRADGSQTHLLVSGNALHGSDLQTIGYVFTIVDVTEHQRAEEARALLIEELERKNKELETFSYSVSHDLRTPLRTIDGFSQMLLEDCGASLDDTGKSHLRRVREASQRMSGLIDDLLELSRLGRSALNVVSVDLSAMARSVVDGLQAKDPERTVDCAIADGLIARADTGLLRIVLENLLGNAWKFTAKTSDPKIEVRAEEARTARGDVVYLIRDNGVGFDMAHADKLFSPFQRLHPASEFPGTGIGLATVYRIIDRHGGRIWAEAEVGRGATISFTLPPKGATAGSGIPAH